MLFSDTIAWIYQHSAVLIASEGSDMSRDKKPQQNEFAQALSFFLQISVTIIACLAVGIFLGWLLDRLLGTTPWLMMVFTFLGIAAAFKSIFDFAKKVR